MVGGARPSTVIVQDVSDFIPFGTVTRTVLGLLRESPKLSDEDLARDVFKTQRPTAAEVLAVTQARTRLRYASFPEGQGGMAGWDAFSGLPSKLGVKAGTLPTDRS